MNQVFNGYDYNAHLRLLYIKIYHENGQIIYENNDVNGRLDFEFMLPQNGRYYCEYKVDITIYLPEEMSYGIATGGKKDILVISTIDKVVPVINSLTASTTGWTNEDVTLTGNAEDNYNENEDNSGLYQYKFNTTNDETEGEWIGAIEGTIPNEITKTHTVTSSGTYYFWVRDRATNVVSKSIDVKIDKTNPTISSKLANTSKTTNSMTMSIGAIDELSGFSKVEWYYKRATDSDYTLYATDTDKELNSEDAGVTTTVTKTKTIDNLQEGTYNVKAVIYDVAGNSIESTVETVTINSIPTLIKDENVTFTMTPSTWTRGQVSVQATTNVSGYTLQISTNNQNWQDSDTAILTENGTIYVRLTDGQNVGGVATYDVTNIDKTAPIVTLSQNGGKYVMPTSGNATIKTKITAQDTNGSGVKTLQYAWSQSNITEPTNWSTFTNGQEIIKSDITTPGIWYLWTNVTDVVGNKATTQKTSNAYIVGSNTETENNITFDISETDWTNGTVTIKPVYGENLTQNKTLTSTGTSGTDYTIDGTTEVIVKTNRVTVTATAQDIAGNTVIATKTVTNIDKEVPTITIETNGGRYTIRDNEEITIKTKVKAEDINGSGIKTVQYAWSHSNTEEPTIWETITNNQEVSKTGIKNEEVWYLWAKAIDNVGNSKILISKAFRTVKDEEEIINRTITYNYPENGGTSVTKETDTKKIGEKVDLSITAKKDGYEFIGWNTNQNATTALDDLTVEDEDITLYAIFKKDIVLQFIDYTGTKQTITTKTLTVYNKNAATTTAPQINQ